MNKYLVNPSGLPGHWQEGDLILEHLNYWMKHLIMVKGMDFDSPYLKECISLNLTGFSKLRPKAREWFGLAPRSGNHNPVDTTNDLNRLAQHYREDKVLTFHRGRDQPYTIPNTFDVGYNKLEDGQLAKFLTRTLADSNCVYDEVGLDS